MRAAAVPLILAIGLGAPALADPAEGLWLTEADNRGQVAHVEVTRCGDAICGEIVKTFNRDGNAILHPNIGKRVFWGMKPVGGGEYEGRAFVPAHNREYPGQITLDGNKMKVGGCFGPICMSQDWRRVR